MGQDRCNLSLPTVGEAELDTMQERFEFWKAIRPQVTDALRPIYLERLPNQTAYTASEWRGRTGECLILLETHH